MIIKFLGMGIVVLSTTLMGIFLSKQDKYRIEDLEEMKKALTLFKGEIGYTAMPLDEIFMEISNRTNTMVSYLFEQAALKMRSRSEGSVASIWEAVLYEQSGMTYFHGEDLAMFSSLGQTLGFSDRNQQIGQISLCLDYIAQKQEELIRKNQKDAKLYRSMGILGGLLICIVLF